jgi:hypothetical protein
MRDSFGMCFSEHVSIIVVHACRIIAEGRLDALPATSTSGCYGTVAL